MLRGLRWQELGPEQRRWVVFRALFVTLVINAAVNALLAVLAVSHERRVPLWGVPLVTTSTTMNAVGTFFFLPLSTSILCSMAVRNDIAAGKLPALEGPPKGILGRIPGGPVRRGLLFGALCTLTLSPLAFAVLAGLDFGNLRPGHFVVYQVIFAMTLGAVVAPQVAVRAMSDPVGAMPDPVPTEPA